MTKHEAEKLLRDMYNFLNLIRYELSEERRPELIDLVTRYAFDLKVSIEE